MNARTSHLLRHAAKLMATKQTPDPLPGLKARWLATPRNQRGAARLALVRALVVAANAREVSRA